MKKINIFVLVVFLAVAVGSQLTKAEVTTEPEGIIDPVAASIQMPSHRQETWISALEWCESNGVVTSVNPKDRDGTPSYYSFQFKPDTFRYYAEKYMLVEPKLPDADIMERMKSYDSQHFILQNMIFDKEVNWSHEFPECTRKLGKPPVT